jgi:hypothetical protein
MNPAVKWTLLASLAAVAGAYFVVVAWRADVLARLLLRRGWDQRGWSEPGLTLGVRVLGVAGAALGFAGTALAVAHLLGW